MPRYRLAAPLLLFTAALTLALICWGGIVKSTGSSLGCPDWPLCYGQLVPDTSYLTPEEARQVFWEYGHRVLATLVGLCSIAALVLCWRRHPAFASLRGAAAGLLGLVIFQGLLGAATVLHGERTGNTSPEISTFHLGTSMLVLLLVVWLARESWLRRAALPAGAAWPAASARGTQTLNLILLAAVYFQILLGAVVRHAGATWAAGAGPRATLLGLDQQTGAFYLFSTTSLFANLNLAHRYVAFGVLLFLFYTALWTWTRVGRAGRPGVRLLFWLPLVLGLAQLVAGIGMIAMQFQLFMRTLHLGLAAGLLAAQFLLVVELRRAART